MGSVANDYGRQASDSLNLGSGPTRRSDQVILNVLHGLLLRENS
jgi:hypothetical protein